MAKILLNKDSLFLDVLADFLEAPVAEMKKQKYPYLNKLDMKKHLYNLSALLSEKRQDIMLFL